MDKDIGDSITLPDGRVLNTHGKDQCSGEYCSVHNPSDHSLVKAPLHWRSDRQLMERMCEHGIGHPDPDDLAHWERVYGKSQPELVAGRGVHGCDGCCSKTELTENQRLRKVLEDYTTAWLNCEPSTGPFPDEPDGGEGRIVAALRAVLDTLIFAESRGKLLEGGPLLTEVIRYAFERKT
jgi:hypothetical protein